MGPEAKIEAYLKKRVLETGGRIAARRIAWSGGPVGETFRASLRRRRLCLWRLRLPARRRRSSNNVNTLNCGEMISM